MHCHENALPVHAPAPAKPPLETSFLFCWYHRRQKGICLPRQAGSAGRQTCPVPSHAVAEGIWRKVMPMQEVRHMLLMKAEDLKEENIAKTLPC